MKPRSLCLLSLGALALTLALAGCGGNPAAPSGGGVVLQGTLVDDAAAASAFSAAGSGRRITITVQENAALTVTVDGNGTFTLSGLPEGSFTLLFSSGGAPLGSLTFSGVLPNQRITIKVKVSRAEVTLLEDEREEGEGEVKACMINGGRVGDRIELEGNVVSVSGTSFMLDVQGNRARHPVQVEAGSATFKCKGGSHAPTPQECKDSLQADRKVHVRGTLQACDQTSALAQASEINIQK